VKNLVLTDGTLTIRYLSDTFAGAMHDKRMAEADPYCLPLGSWLLQDLGFLGFSLDGVETLTPFKTPKGGALTLLQKAFNRQLASLRVQIEHVISSVKRCRIAKDICRLRLPGALDAVMEIACSLHNFRLALFPWQPLIKSE
jgi:DDE superfamily endonuclease